MKGLAKGRLPGRAVVLVGVERVETGGVEEGDAIFLPSLPPAAATYDGTQLDLCCAFFYSDVQNRPIERQRTDQTNEQTDRNTEWQTDRQTNR